MKGHAIQHTLATPRLSKAKLTNWSCRLFAIAFHIAWTSPAPSTTRTTVVLMRRAPSRERMTARRAQHPSYESGYFACFAALEVASPQRIDLQFASRGINFENTEDLWCSSECTPPCQGGGRGFKSRQVRSTPERVTRLGRVAQLVERAPEKREVTGSTPVSTTIAVVSWKFFPGTTLFILARPRPGAREPCRGANSRWAATGPRAPGCASAHAG